MATQQEPSTAESLPGRNGTYRWLVRAVVLVIVIVLVTSGVNGFVDLVANPRSPGTGRASLIVQLVGTVLRVGGLAALLVSQALAFTDLTTYFKVFTPPPGTQRSWRARSRTRRQIEGKTPFTEDEVPLLRATAHWLLSLQTPRVASVGLLTFALGMALAPLPLPDESGMGALWSATSRVMQVLSGVLFVVLLGSLARSRPRFVAARRFLDQTETSALAP